MHLALQREVYVLYRSANPKDRLDLLHVEELNSLLQILQVLRLEGAVLLLVVKQLVLIEQEVFQALNLLGKVALQEANFLVLEDVAELGHLLLHEYEELPFGV